MNKKRVVDTELADEEKYPKEIKREPGQISFKDALKKVASTSKRVKKG